MYCRVFPGWGSGEQESWSRVGGLARGPDADTGSSLWMSRQGAGSPAHVVINSLPTKIGWERADGRRDRNFVKNSCIHQ